MREEPFEVAIVDGVLRGHRGGEGPPALLLHGGPGMGDYTEACAAELGAVLTVHRYTQRGASPTTVGPPYSVESHVANVVAVLDAVELERAWAVGHSWGGFLALHLLLTHPERLLGVICLSTLGAFSPFDELAPALQRRLTTEQVARVDELQAMRIRGQATEADLVGRFGLLWPNYHADPSNPPPNPVTRFGPRCSADTNASIARHFELGTLERGLPQATLPAFFVHGELDPLPLHTAEETAALISGARFHILEGLGHFPWLERPGVVGAAVARFLGL